MCVPSMINRIMNIFKIAMNLIRINNALSNGVWSILRKAWYSICVQSKVKTVRAFLLIITINIIYIEL